MPKTLLPFVSPEASGAIVESIPIAAQVDAYVCPTPSKTHYLLAGAAFGLMALENANNAISAARSKDWKTASLAVGMAFLQGWSFQNHIETANEPTDWSKYGTTERTAGVVATAGFVVAQKVINSRLGK